MPAAHWMAWPFLVLATAATADVPAPEASAGAPRPVLFSAQSRIEVDATGAVTAVSPSAALPEAINRALAENLRKLRFTPATLDGRPVPGVTFARQEACAVPEGGAFRLAVRFLGNGPGATKAPDGFPAPRYPAEAQRAGASATVKVGYRVEPNGEVVVESTELVKGRGPHSRTFLETARSWTDGLRAEPEQLDGRPVATRVSYTIEFTVGQTFSGPAARALMQRHAEKEQARHDAERVASSATCATAFRERDALPAHVALDSPFRSLPLN